MILRNLLLGCLLVVMGTWGQSHDWDLAVAVYDQIELLKSNGTLVGTTKQQFTTLKALTFDGIRHQFIVSDMDDLNDTIFTVQLTKEADITPIVKDLPDDVKGLSIDPVTDTLYWTDAKNHTINYVKLNESTADSASILLALSDENPQDVVVDVCRRFIYWTNANPSRPTIERARLDGTDRTVLIDSDLRLPVGIAVDYTSQRLYWADRGEGIYYRIESSNLLGKEREIVYEGTHTKPFGIAIAANAIFWTDVNNNALWRMEIGGGALPEKIREFEEKPRGVVGRNAQIRQLPECDLLVKTSEQVKGVEKEEFELVASEELVQSELVCLNAGVLRDGQCVCGRGFTGTNCELAVCHNFCMRGSCHLSSRGYPTCHCPNGYGGGRCELNLCNGFCLNGGVCSYDNKPSCRCSGEFGGVRCEEPLDFNSLCEIFCRDRADDRLSSANNELTCRCIDGAFFVSKSNLTGLDFMAQSLQDNWQSMDLQAKLQDPIFIFLASLVLTLVFVIMFLSFYVCKTKKVARPRIRKRIIVNKNVTPLTYRPQPTEQCEITIENCCNMNVCETPCFEPASMRGKTDDKKKLLANMESGEDLY